ncbi:MAG: YkgJ family cysteine cluster protein [Chthoniobacterales bacterium]
MRLNQHPEQKAALAEIRAIYTDLANRPADRNCTLKTECCHFKLTGLMPHLTRGEALLAAKALRASGRRELPQRKDGACPLLHPETSRCMIYADRPFGCRTHFCEAAGGPYARREVLDLIRRLEKVDADLNGRGPRLLAGAIADELEDLG